MAYTHPKPAAHLKYVVPEDKNGPTRRTPGATTKWGKLRNSSWWRNWGALKARPQTQADRASHLREEYAQNPFLTPFGRRNLEDADGIAVTSDPDFSRPGDMGFTPKTAGDAISLMQHDLRVLQRKEANQAQLNRMLTFDHSRARPRRNQEELPEPPRERQQASSPSPSLSARGTVSSPSQLKKRQERSRREREWRTKRPAIFISSAPRVRTPKQTAGGGSVQGSSQGISPFNIARRRQPARPRREQLSKPLSPHQSAQTPQTNSPKARALCFPYLRRGSARGPSVVVSDVAARGRVVCVCMGACLSLSGILLCRLSGVNACVPGRRSWLQGRRGGTVPFSPLRPLAATPRANKPSKPQVSCVPAQLDAPRTEAAHLPPSPHVPADPPRGCPSPTRTAVAHRRAVAQAELRPAAAAACAGGAPAAADRAAQ